MAARARRRRASHRPTTADSAAARRARANPDLGRSRRGHRRRSRRARRMLGLYALAPSCAHALRIGRQSALLVTPAPLATADGWRDGWCATSVDDGWAAVEVSGEDAENALMQATSADLASGSPSAAVLVFGLRGLLVRTPSGFRVHVEAPWLETLLDLARRGLRRSSWLVTPDDCATADRESSTKGRPSARGCSCLRGNDTEFLSASPTSHQPQPRAHMKRAHEQIHRDHPAHERAMRRAERLRPPPRAAVMSAIVTKVGAAARPSHSAATRAIAARRHGCRRRPNGG